MDLFYRTLLVGSGHPSIGKFGLRPNEMKRNKGLGPTRTSCMQGLLANGNPDSATRRQRHLVQERKTGIAVQPVRTWQSIRRPSAVSQV
jgi:hypothetical protein